MIVLLYSGPLGTLTNPKGSAVTVECRMWVRSFLLKGYKLCWLMKVEKELLLLQQMSAICRDLWMLVTGGILTDNGEKVNSHNLN